MHLKSPTTTPAPTTTANSVANENRKNTQNSRTMMAATTSNSLSEDNGGGGSGNRINSNNNNNNNNSHSNEDNVSSNTAQMDEAEVKLKKQTLEQRKLELERLLSEKSWLLQQIQKQETQILNGNYEYLNAKEIFAMLALQYKQEHGTDSGGGGVEGSGTSAILRRKTVGSKENNNNNNNRQSEISNRSSEYDNYPASGGGGGELNAGSVAGGEVSAGGSVLHMTAQQQTAKTALKKRATPTPTPTMANLNYNQAQRQQMLHQQMLQTNLQYAALLQHPHYHQQQQQQLYQQQQQQQQQLLYQQQQQQQSPQQRHYQTDAISLYSMNSTNVATLRQQHVAPQQQPIVVQCDRYYLSPTHQSYHDGGFIKSSQNIKKYVSPMASPTSQHPHQHHPHELLLEENDALLPPQHPQHLTPSQQKLQRMLWYHYQQQEHASSRQLDAISLAPSYISVDAETHSMRWRSQSNLPPAPHAASHAGSTLAGHSNQDVKSHSSDMLANNAYYTSTNPSPHLKPKPLDEISISSLNSETQKAKPSKPKQWLESSLDGPVMRTQSVPATHATMEVFQNTSTSVRLPPSKAHVAAAAPAGNGGGAARERAKLSSQSMSSARHYSMSSHKHPLHSKLLADDDGRYAKLSQSTSYLNSMEPMVPSSSISAAYHLDVTPTNTCIDLPPTPVLFAYLPPKPGAAASVATQFTPPPPPRPPPANEKVATTPAPLSPPDIRIESPKNMTVVQQATFQPYKEETKPFEMSDFYKYSTKFRQKESSVSTANVD